MDDEFTKEYLLGGLRGIRATMLWKLEGLGEYDVRRPLTPTGTNLLGLVKHLTNTEARYFGEVFGRPFPERLPWWGDDDYEPFGDLWATADESRAEIVDRYRRACDHSDATIAALDIDAPGHVPWWPRPDVKLFNVMVHLLAETYRHAATRTSCESSSTERWAPRRSTRSWTRSTQSSGRPAGPASNRPPRPPTQSGTDGPARRASCPPSIRPRLVLPQPRHRRDRRRPVAEPSAVGVPRCHRRPLVFQPDGTAGTVVSIVSTTAIAVWALLEIAAGSSPFRRVLGAVVLVAALAGLLLR